MVSGTIRVPSPTMYASKLAFATAQHLGTSQEAVPPALYDKLHYL